MYKKTRQEKQFQHELESWLQHIDQILCQNSYGINKDMLFEERQRLQNHLDHILEKKSYAAFIRSRCKQIEEGEKSSSYFLNLEKKRQIHNSIYKLSDEKGN